MGNLTKNAANQKINFIYHLKKKILWGPITPLLFSLFLLMPLVNLTNALWSKFKTLGVIQVISSQFSIQIWLVNNEHWAFMKLTHVVRSPLTKNIFCRKNDEKGLNRTKITSEPSFTELKTIFWIDRTVWWQNMWIYLRESNVWWA